MSLGKRSFGRRRPDIRSSPATAPLSLRAPSPAAARRPIIFPRSRPRSSLLPFSPFCRNLELSASWEEGQSGLFRTNPPSIFFVAGDDSEPPFPLSFPPLINNSAWDIWRKRDGRAWERGWVIRALHALTKAPVPPPLLLCRRRIVPHFVAGEEYSAAVRRNA